MEHLVWVVFVLAGVIGLPVLGAVTARRRGRSPVAWLFIVFTMHLVGLCILLLLPRANLTCPRWAQPYGSPAKTCARCGASLPAPETASLLAAGEVFDRQCSGCATPYRLADYRPDAAHIYCSTCHAELPRELDPTPAPAQVSAG